MGEKKGKVKGYTSRAGGYSHALPMMSMDESLTAADTSVAESELTMDSDITANCTEKFMADDEHSGR